MGRGRGPRQDSILSILEPEDIELAIGKLAARVFNVPVPTHSQLSQVGEACKRLEKRGLIERREVGREVMVSRRLTPEEATRRRQRHYVAAIKECLGAPHGGFVCFGSGEVRPLLPSSDPCKR
jgi:hypothetical protein